MSVPFLFATTSTDTISAPGLLTKSLSSTAFISNSDFVVAETGLSRVLSTSDNGRCITLSKTNMVTACIPNNLPLGFNVMFIQINTGQVVVSAGGSVTLNSADSKKKLNKQHSSAGLLCYSNNTYNLAGDLA